MMFTSPLPSISIYLLLRYNAAHSPDDWTAGTTWRVTRRLLHPVDTSHYETASCCDVGHVPVMYGDSVPWTFAFVRVPTSFNPVHSSLTTRHDWLASSSELTKLLLSGCLRGSTRAFRSRSKPLFKPAGSRRHGVFRNERDWQRDIIVDLIIPATELFMTLHTSATCWEVTLVDDLWRSYWQATYWQRCCSRPDVTEQVSHSQAVNLRGLLLFARNHMPKM